MASKSETGHARNVANFESLISFCTSYGDAYNPSKESLSIEALNKLLISARQAISDTTNTKNQLDLVINERQVKFSPLKQTATRIINSLAASNSPEKTTDDAKSINNKIQGRRSSPKPEESTEKTFISTSQQSFDNVLDNFKKLVDLLAEEPNYKPNEIELQVQTLQAYIQELQSASTAVINATTVYSNSRIERNKILYIDNTGMIDIALDVKLYVKSVFGTTSPEYKQISKIRFRK